MVQIQNGVMELLHTQTITGTQVVSLWNGQAKEQNFRVEVTQLETIQHIVK
jgi:hypothetical protein